MECIDNPDIKYEKFLYKLGVKKKDDIFGYFVPVVEIYMFPEDVEAEKERFLKSCENKNGIRHNKYCIEYTIGNETFIEYIMGFVALK